MSRPSTSTSRSLTLTEELEKLEQSITLTLQEIDHNFSKAHRIVTSSILPVVEQYAEHSRNVWEGSKFWKRFFEASANVSLSGYEEPALEEDLTNTGTISTHDSTFETPPQPADDDTITGDDGAEYQDDGDEEESLLQDSPSNATGVHSTPRLPPSTIKGKSKTKALTSPPPKSLAYRNAPLSEEPSTPRPQPNTNAADSSPFEPPSAYQISTGQRQQNNDPLLHRVLDRNYRVQATPHTSRKTARPAQASKATPATATRTAFDSSPMSSPEVAAPQLRSDLFSPEKAQSPRKNAAPGPRTPGVSLQTPGQQRMTTSTGRSLFSANKTGDKRESNLTSRTPALWDSDSDDDPDTLGMSPPKTMQFVVPQSRLLQTPAREASRRIVEDLLMTAGAEATDEIEGVDQHQEEVSPSVVRKRWEDEDDTF